MKNCGQKIVATSDLWQNSTTLFVASQQSFDVDQFENEVLTFTALNSRRL